MQTSECCGIGRLSAFALFLEDHQLAALALCDSFAKRTQRCWVHRTTAPSCPLSCKLAVDVPSHCSQRVDQDETKLTLTCRILEALRLGINVRFLAQLTPVRQASCRSHLTPFRLRLAALLILHAAAELFHQAHYCSYYDRAIS